MKSQKTLMSFLRASSLGAVLMALAKGLSRAVPIWIGGLLLLAGLDRWIELAPAGRQAIWALFALGGGAALVSGFWPFRLFSLLEKSKNLSQRNPALRPDDLRLSVELSREKPVEGTSVELREIFLERTVQKLERSSPFWCFPSWAWRRPVLLAAVLLLMTGTLRAFFPTLLPIGARTLFPFWSFQLEKKIKIEPGDAEVPFGKDAQVRLRLLEEIEGKPTVMVKTGEQWLEIEPSMESGGEITYVVRSVVAPLSYRVGWRGEWSRRFTLTPVHPLSVAAFAVRLTPPDYTGKMPVQQTSPEITGLAGTHIDMEIEANAALDKAVLVFADQREVPADRVTDKIASFHFILSENENYGFIMTPPGGSALRGETNYPIHVVEDKAPTITLLSPDQDVVIGEKEKLPITYDARDDFGLGEIVLSWETAPGTEKRRRVAAFDTPTESSLSTYSWDLALQRFAPGQVVRFRVGAVDKNRITGPGEAWSDWRVLEIRSFDREHAVIEKALENWRDKAVETLAQVTTLQKKLGDEKADMSALANQFNPPQKSLEMMDEALKEILKRMEQDPMADYGVWLEHKAMEENLALLNQTTAKNTQAAFQTQNKSAALENLDSIGKELERMTALSEDLSKSQKARDVTDAGEKLDEVGDDLMSQLKNAKTDPESMAKINQLLGEAQKGLMEMAQALQDMPQELPDDFVNQEALKNLELGKSQDLLSQISDAIKKGDMQRAMELAQKFAAAAKAMKKQIAKAHESFLKSNSAEELGKKISEQARALETITDQQSQLLAETQKLASEQMDALMKEQEDLLASLAQRQERVINEAKPVGVLANQLPIMIAVGGEFRSKRVDKSPEWLATVVAQSQVVQILMEKSSATASALDVVKKVQEEEASILDALKNPPAPKQTASPEAQEAYADLQSRQQELRKKTQDVKQRLQVLSRKTASLGTPLMQALTRAGGEMKSASGELGDKNGVVAQRSEERALDNLRQGQSELEQAQSAMSDMAMEQGGDSEGGDTPGDGQGQRRGNGPKVILRSGGKGGRGQQTGRVKLPNADDYRAPKAFREDLMESLKENYPKIYEDIIHNYYKRLAE